MTVKLVDVQERTGVLDGRAREGLLGEIHGQFGADADGCGEETLAEVGRGGFEVLPGDLGELLDDRAHLPGVRGGVDVIPWVDGVEGEAGGDAGVGVLGVLEMVGVGPVRLAVGLFEDAPSGVVEDSFGVATAAGHFADGLLCEEGSDRGGAHRADVTGSRQSQPVTETEGLFQSDDLGPGEGKTLAEIDGVGVVGDAGAGADTLAVDAGGEFLADELDKRGIGGPGGDAEQTLVVTPTHGEDEPVACGNRVRENGELEVFRKLSGKFCGLDRVGREEKPGRTEQVGDKPHLRDPPRALDLSPTEISIKYHSGPHVKWFSSVLEGRREHFLTGRADEGKNRAFRQVVSRPWRAFARSIRSSMSKEPPCTLCARRTSWW